MCRSVALANAAVPALEDTFEPRPFTADGGQLASGLNATRGWGSRMRMSRTRQAVAIVTVGLIIASCSTKHAAVDAAKPCDAFRARDAATLLNVQNVRNVSFQTLVGSAASGPDKAQIDAASRYICAYRPRNTDTAPTAVYQYGYNSGPNTFASEKSFLSANLHDGAEQVDVGQAAIYSPAGSDPSAPKNKANIVVLLSGGRNFTLGVVNATITKRALTSSARSVAARL